MFAKNPLFISLLCSLCIITFSCDKSKEEIALLEKEVLDIHDEVMPMMGPGTYMDSLSLSLTDSLEVYLADTAAVAKAKAKTFQEAIGNLESANESMMVWMREYQPGMEEGETPVDRIAYLQSELAKVKEMKEQTLTSIEEAKSLIE
ncbi:MAG: hypothetical protein AAF655_04185 [Bacteroidota bacterium]